MLWPMARQDITSWESQAEYKGKEGQNHERREQLPEEKDVRALPVSHRPHGNG